MPLLDISINTPVSPEKRSELAKAAAAIVTDVLGKDPNFVMVKVQDEVTMCFAGSDEPCSFVALKSVGAIDPESNDKVASAVCALMSEHLAIAPTRVFINFHDIDRANWGWNSKTFA